MWKELKQASIGILIVFFALTLGACSSSSGSSDGNKNQASEITPGAFYIGRILQDGEKAVGDSLISPTGKFVVAFSDESNSKESMTFGTLEFSDSGKISGDIEEYVSGTPWKRTDGTISGQVTSSETADLGAKRPGFSSNSVLQRKPEVSDTGVTLKSLSATYTDSNNTSITINSEGAVTGSSQPNCVLSGDVEIPNEAVNVFEVSIKVETCDEFIGEEIDGKRDFNGLGNYDPDGPEVQIFSRNGSIPWRFEGTQ